MRPIKFRGKRIDKTIRVAVMGIVFGATVSLVLHPLAFFILWCIK